RRVVITGMGAVTPIGLTVSQSWESCLNARSGVGPITLFDAQGWQVQIGAELKGFDPAGYMDIKDARRRDRFEQIAVAAAKEALADSGFEITEANAGRVGVLVGSAVGGAQSWQDGVDAMRASGPRRVDP